MKSADAVNVALLFVMLPQIATAQAVRPVIAFVDVNVLTMTDERVSAGQTVVVQDGRVVSLGDTGSVRVPEGAQVVDGAGRYLLPGLTDAHVHLPTGMPWAPTRRDFGDAPIYLSYGVTSVVNLGGTPEQLDWRRRVESGEWIGPTIYSSGPFVNEPRVTTPDEVAQDIAAQSRDGFDLVKFHELPQTSEGLSAAAYHRMIEAAARARMPLIGHAPVNLGLEAMLSAHQSVAHLGMLSNIYFLPFTSNRLVLLTTAVAALVVVVAAILGLTGMLLRRTAMAKPASDRSRRMLRKISTSMALATVFAFVLAAAYLPGGPLFDSTILRIAFTLLAVVVGAATVMAIVIVRRRLGDATASMSATLYALTVAAAGAVLTILLFTFWIPVSWRSSDDGIDGLAQRIRDAGIYVQSTLIVYESLSSEGRLALSDDPGVDLLLPATRDAWRQLARDQPAMPLFRLRGFMQKVVYSLHRHGVPIMAGTDAMGIELIAPGSSLYRELQLLFASGLSTYDVVRSATVVPAAFLGKSDEFGTIAPGQRADLLLVSGNPLRDLSVLKQPVGVMARGRWIPRQEFDLLLQRLH